MLELLKKRRSIRKYTSQKIQKEKIIKIIQSGLLSPSSKNSKPWEFIVVEDKAKLQKLSFTKPGAAFLKNAALGIVVLGNSELSDVWIEDASIASVLMHITAEAEGLGSCWIQVRNRKYNDNITSEDYVRQILNIPSNINVLSIISIGYAAQTPSPADLEKLQYGKVYLDNYADKYSF
ncbi:nitroreductase family protein [Clostridium sp. JNZ X4-2]